MSWAIGYDRRWERDIGYGVPAICDHPGCGKQIDRGLAYVCGSGPYGEEHGCGLFFCLAHLGMTDRGQLCERCDEGKEPFAPTKDTNEWLNHKMTDDSWAQWRHENPTPNQGGFEDSPVNGKDEQNANQRRR